MNRTFFPHQQIHNAGNILVVLMLLRRELWRQQSTSAPVDVPRMTLYISSLNFTPIPLIKMRSPPLLSVPLSQQPAGLFTSWVDL